MWVKSAFARYGQVPNRNGITGAEAARRILHTTGLGHVRIAAVGQLIYFLLRSGMLGGRSDE